MHIYTYKNRHNNFLYKEYHTFAYAHKSNYLNSYSISYLSSSTKSTAYGNIVNFFQSPNVKLCLVQKFDILPSNICDETSNPIIQRYAPLFFINCKLSDLYELIDFHSIDGKCVLVETKNEHGSVVTTLTPCVGFVGD